MIARCTAVVAVIVLGGQISGCAAARPDYREVGKPIRGLAAQAVMDAGELVLKRLFPIEQRDDEAMTIVTGEASENTVPGSRLERYRRKAYLKIGTIEGAVRTWIHVPLDRAEPKTPIIYTALWEPSWNDIGRDREMEETIAREIREALGM